jgi:hypothetical protein
MAVVFKLYLVSVLLVRIRAEMAERRIVALRRAEST